MCWGLAQKKKNKGEQVLKNKFGNHKDNIWLYLFLFAFPAGIQL